MLIEAVSDSGAEGSPSPTRAGTHRRPGVQKIATHYGLLIVFALVIVVFSIARPDTFPTLNNLRTILAQAAPPLILAAGLTVVLAMQDFDLSFGSMMGVANGVVVVLIVQAHTAWPVAVLVGILAAVIGGLINGTLVAILGGSSFIMTLATQVGFTGVEFWITNQNEIFQGLPNSFLALGQKTSLLGLNNAVWIAVVICLAVWILLEKTEAGRYMYAIGGNSEAARLSGVPVRKLRVFGFILVAVAAAVVGTLLAALSSGYTPNIGPPYLLPAYAAAFLGAAVFRPGEFNLLGSAVAVLFLGVIQTGLFMLNLPTYVINLVEAAILISAVLLSVMGSRR
jgi:ribose transport system permease protein